MSLLNQLSKPRVASGGRDKTLHHIYKASPALISSFPTVQSQHLPSSLDASSDPISSIFSFTLKEIISVIFSP